jgi:GntR family transcriptional regulator
MSLAQAIEPIRASFRPLYVQVADFLRKRIVENEWQANLALPNETTLANQYGVSIGTVRKAVESLERESLVVRKQGRGTFVRNVSDDAEFSRFGNIYIGDTPLDYRATAVDYGIATPTEAEALKLGLAPSESVIRIKRLLQTSIGQRGAETIVLRAAHFPDLDENGTLREPLLFPLYRQAYGINIAEAVETATANNADAALAASLQVPLGHALLRVDRLARNPSAQPIEWSLAHFDARNLAYVVRR